MNAGQMLQDTSIRQKLNALHSATIDTQAAILKLLEAYLVQEEAPEAWDELAESIETQACLYREANRGRT